MGRHTAGRATMGCMPCIARETDCRAHVSCLALMPHCHRSALRHLPQPDHRVVPRHAHAQRAPRRVAPGTAVEQDAVVQAAVPPAVHRGVRGHAVCVPADDLEAFADVGAAGDLTRLVPHAARFAVFRGIAAGGPRPLRRPAVRSAAALRRMAFEVGDMRARDPGHGIGQRNRRQPVLRAVVEDAVDQLRCGIAVVGPDHRKTCGDDQQRCPPGSMAPSCGSIARLAHAASTGKIGGL